MLGKVFLIALLLTYNNVGYGQDTGSEDNFSYPCDSLDNLDCIRNYFENTGLCSASSHRDGEPIHKAKQVTYVPRINVTIESFDDDLTFFGSKVEAFYINQDTNNLVMAVNFDGINLASSNTNYYISQRAREPLPVKDYVNNTYFPVLTAIIPSAGRDGIGNARVTAYNTKSSILNLGPAITESSIPAVQAVYQGFLDDITSSVEELLLTKAPYFFFNYLQEYICDYSFEFIGDIH